MPRDNQSAEIDELILDIAQQASLMPRGKTINADMFPAKAKLLQILMWMEDQEDSDALALLAKDISVELDKLFKELKERR